MVSMGTVWDRATEFLSDNLSAVISIAFVAILLPSAISSSLQPLTVTPGATAIMVQLLSLILSIVSLWGQLAIVALAIEPGAGKRAANAIASRRLAPVVALLIVLLLAAFVLILPAPIVLAFSGFDFQAAMAGGNVAMPPGVGGILLLYLAVLALVMLWLGARLILLLPVMVMEGRWFGALGRSFRLTRPIWLRALGVILLYVIVCGVAVLAAKLVFGTIFGLLSRGDGPVTIGSVLTAIMVAIVMTAFNVLASAFTGKLYLAVRDAREAIVESR